MFAVYLVESSMSVFSAADCVYMQKRWILDIEKTPCARDALLHGILGGIALGLVYFAKSSNRLICLYCNVCGPLYGGILAQWHSKISNYGLLIICIVFSFHCLGRNSCKKNGICTVALVIFLFPPTLTPAGLVRRSCNVAVGGFALVSLGSWYNYILLLRIFSNTDIDQSLFSLCI